MTPFTCSSFCSDFIWTLGHGTHSMLTINCFQYTPGDSSANCACARVRFKGNGPGVQSAGFPDHAEHKQNRTTHTERERERQQSPRFSLYLWQVGQSRLQSKVLSFPQPSCSLQDLARSFSTAWQCSAKWRYTRAQGPLVYKSTKKERKKVSRVIIQCKTINRGDWQRLEAESSSPPPTPSQPTHRMWQ